jgi:hypothetical protein
MRERSYWDECADAMELTIEGNRLIVGEIAACVRDEWTAAMRRIAHYMHRAPNIRQSPPV